MTHDRSRRTQTRPDLKDPYNIPRLMNYVRSVADWHGYIKFLGLPHLQEGTDISIQRLYVETYAHERYVRPDEDPKTWAKGRYRLVDLVAKHRRVLLLGDPGSGKSTLIDWIAWNFTRWDEGDWLYRFGPLVPIPIVIRELKITPSITWDGLCEAFLGHLMTRGRLTRAELDDLLRRGQAIVLIDGLDEISDLETRKQLRLAIYEGMATTARECPWLLTSRIIGYDEVPYDRIPSEFVDFDPEAISAVKDGPKRVDGSLAVEIVTNIARYYCCPFDDQQVSAFARTWFVAREPNKPEVGEQRGADFVRCLRAAPAPAALSRLPNLLTLFALVFRVLAEIPYGRSVLYGKVAEAYLESIDKARGFKPRFTRDRMERWLAFVAFHLQKRRAEAAEQEPNTTVEEILFPRSELVKLLTVEMNSISGAPSPEEAEGFLEFVARRSGLLIPRGEGQFAFMHLSFQDYFAARFLEEQVTSPEWILDEPTYPGTSPADLQKYTDSSIWTETLILLFELLKNKPRWTAALRKKVFGDSYTVGSTLIANDMYAPPRAELLAELIVNPHTGLDDTERERDLPALVDWELRRQQLEGAGSLLRTFLMPSGYRPAKRFRIVWDRVQQTSSLKRLDLSDCTGMTDLGPVSTLTALESLYLVGCTGVMDLGPIGSLNRLRRLKMNGCKGVTNLGPISTLNRLENLHLSDCTGVTDLGPIEKLTGLIWLFLENCTGVTDLGPLGKLIGKLTGLREVDLTGCTNIRSNPDTLRRPGLTLYEP